CSDNGAFAVLVADPAKIWKARKAFAEADRARIETGYAMTQLLPRRGEGCVVIGFDRHDRFQQTFACDARRAPTALTIQTVWDRKSHTGHCESERLVLFEHAHVEEGLREWARIVAHASPRTPRPSPPIIGWCSWYNLYAYINEENILAHLRGVEKIARQENLPLRVFQIDDGFTPEMGDWLEVKPQFPRGMKPLLDDIRAAGLIPGLWIAPFMVGNRSRLYREHPDWVVRERTTDAPLAHWKLYAEFRWHKRSEEYYILDATHPDAFEYLRRVFRTWRREWGCEYFKTDFMFWGAEYGPDRARWYRDGSTRIEIWRRVAEMIREEIGEALWLGCGCPLWASVGLVDSVRIGRDVGVAWRGDLSAQSLLRDAATRNFANHILWQADPDCILLRERFHHLTDTQLRSLALYAGMIGGVTMTSDALDELSPERLRLWKLLLAPGVCRFPFLGQTDPVSVQVRDPFVISSEARNLCAVLIFNTTDAPVERTYTFDALGIANAQYVYDWTKQPTLEVSKTSRVSVMLAPHDSALLFVSDSPIKQIPERLP
ncbi:MAG: alpha-galactosidase, partial [Anaerolineae bacterium]|nr:alpha-galactosidase [Anaerolineae bacterium]